MEITYKHKLKARQKRILETLLRLGGIATTRQIAATLSLHVNGVSQSLSALASRKYVQELDGSGGDTRWQYASIM